MADKYKDKQEQVNQITIVKEKIENDLEKNASVEATKEDHFRRDKAEEISKHTKDFLDDLDHAFKNKIFKVVNDTVSTILYLVYLYGTKNDEENMNKETYDKEIAKIKETNKKLKKENLSLKEIIENYKKNKYTQKIKSQKQECEKYISDCKSKFEKLSKKYKLLFNKYKEEHRAYLELQNQVEQANLKVVEGSFSSNESYNHGEILEHLSWIRKQELIPLINKIYFQNKDCPDLSKTDLILKIAHSIYMHLFRIQSNRDKESIELIVKNIKSISPCIVIEEECYKKIVSLKERVVELYNKMDNVITPGYLSYAESGENFNSKHHEWYKKCTPEGEENHIILGTIFPGYWQTRPKKQLLKITVC